MGFFQLEWIKKSLSFLRGIIYDVPRQNSAKSALLIGAPEEIAAKILRHSEALGVISRFTFQMDNEALPHAKLMRSI